MLNEDLTFDKTQLTEKLPEMLGDAFYNDPQTKQQPTKAFDNINDLPSLFKMAITAQRGTDRLKSEYDKKYEGHVKIPNEQSTPEEVAAYKKVADVPDRADGYELVIPQDADEADKAGFEAISKVIKEAAVGALIPRKVLSGLWTKVVAAISAQNKLIEDRGLEAMRNDEAALKTEKGEKYDSFLKTGDDALNKFTNGKAVADLLTVYGIRNHPAIRKLFGDEIAPLVLEAATVGGGGAPAGGDNWPINYDEVVRKE